jgi:hypothetical protein
MVLSELGIAAGCNPGPNSTIFEMDFKENGLMNLGPIFDGGIRASVATHGWNLEKKIRWGEEI